MARRTNMATNQWRKECVKYYKFYLHKEIDSDILEWFEKQPNKREYIKSLLRKDMNGHKEPTDKEN